MLEIHEGMEHLGPLDTIRIKVEVPIEWLDYLPKEDLIKVQASQIQEENYETAQIIAEKLRGK